MFCPRCGQQQISDEVRFCPRCGFQLSAVAGLLTTGGVAPSELTGGGESARARGVRQGMRAFFVGLVVTAVLAVLFAPDNAPDQFPGILVPLSAVILVLGGLLRMFYALIFEEGRRRQQPGANAYAPAYAPPERLAAQEAAALPPPQSIPARAYAPPPRPHTAEMRSPPSVTDSTTKLLKDTPDDATR